MNSDSDLKDRRDEAIADGLVESRKGTVATALVIIAVGVVLLLNQMGIFPPGFVFYFWPTIFILAGLAQMLVKRGMERLWGAGLVLLGVILELNKLGITHLRFHNLWPLFIIGAGVALLWNTLKEKPASWTVSSKVPEFNSTYIFSGTDRKVDTKTFRGGKITAVFGGFKIDLTRSEMEGGEAVLQVDAVFGGGEIIVPATWVVVVEGSGVFGAFEDRTRYVQPDSSQPKKTLFVRGAAVFGGVVIKN
jgi:predicted membrane protein